MKFKFKKILLISLTIFSVFISFSLESNSNSQTNKDNLISNDYILPIIRNSNGQSLRPHSELINVFSIINTNRT